MGKTTRVVICGAGIAGVSAAHRLSQSGQDYDVLLVDDSPPLTLTSDKSSEAYRSWWPDPVMAAFMDRSIDLLDRLAVETGNAFLMNRRGYLYAITDPRQQERFIESAQKTAQACRAELRTHNSRSGDAYNPLEEAVHGADLLLDPDLIRKHFPFLSEDTQAALHVRRAGWLSAHLLGTLLLEQARQNGLKLTRGRVTGLETRGGRLCSVRLADGSTVDADVFVNAAGPFVKEIGKMASVDLPVENEVHLKCALKDTFGIIPRTAPLTILAQPLQLDWSALEREALQEEGLEELLAELPAGAHLRPEGPSTSPIILLLWDFHPQASEPRFPIEPDPMYTEVVLRGLARLVPGLQAYIDRPQRPNVDGGYYTRTPENRPLIGPLGPEGCYVFGALSGFGIMASLAGAELLEAHIKGEPLPDYAGGLDPKRYEDPDYLLDLGASEDGQL